MTPKRTAGSGHSIRLGALMVLALGSGMALAATPAAERVQPMARPATPAPKISRQPAADARARAFDLELAAYKQTLMALQRDLQQLRAHQRRLDALSHDTNSDADVEKLQLQSVMSERQTAIQLTNNIVKHLNDSQSGIIHNMKP